jgi:hypothetical protein
MKWVRYVERIREMRYLYIIYFDNVEEKDHLGDLVPNNSGPWSYFVSHKYILLIIPSFLRVFPLSSLFPACKS